MNRGGADTRVTWRSAWQRSRAAMGANKKATVNASLSRSQVLSRSPPPKVRVQPVHMRVCVVQALSNSAAAAGGCFWGLPNAADAAVHPPVRWGAGGGAELGPV